MASDRARLRPLGLDPAPTGGALRMTGAIRKMSMSSWAPMLTSIPKLTTTRTSVQECQRSVQHTTPADYLGVLQPTLVVTAISTMEACITKSHSDIGVLSMQRRCRLRHGDRHLHHHPHHLQLVRRRLLMHRSNRYGDSLSNRRRTVTGARKRLDWMGFQLQCLPHPERGSLRLKPTARCRRRV
jgi:hypothetical protein